MIRKPGSGCEPILQVANIMMLIKKRAVKVGENKYFTVISTCYLRGDDDKMKCLEQKARTSKRGLRKRELKLLISKNNRRPRT